LGNKVGLNLKIFTKCGRDKTNKIMKNIQQFFKNVGVAILGRQSGRGKHISGKSIETYKTNKNMKKKIKTFCNCVAWQLWAVC